VSTAIPARSHARRPGRRDRVVAALTDVPLFARCTRSDLRIVARHMDVVQAPAGTTLVAEGDPGDAFFVLLDGFAQVVRGERRRAVLRPGDHFGELALLDPAPRAATVVATSDVVLGALGSRMLHVLLKELPMLSARMMASLAARLREADPGPQ
jgi:CRP-like cAMP-binding protein